jgi:subtilisin family serine protease
LKHLILALFAVNAYAISTEGYRTLPVVVTEHNYGGQYRGSTPTPALNVVKKAKYKIVIIDTGYDPLLAAFPIRLCEKGHYDFYSESSVLARTVNHGSMVASIIAATLEGVDYCAVIYQIVDKRGVISETTMARAFALAAKEHPTAVNVSITGPSASQLEEKLLLRLSDSGAKIFVAAGNEKNNLNLACGNYPACYHVPNLVVVGAVTDDMQQPASYSNYGTKVKLWFPGSYSDSIQHADGTSFATPRALADFILSLSSPLAK